MKNTDDNDIPCSSKSNSSDEECRSRLIEERKTLEKALLDQSGSFDKWVLTLASGALALSLTFIEKIVPHPDTNTINFLIGAWSCFGSSILLTLISFLFSQKACLKNIEIIEKLLKKDESPVSNSFTIMTDILNWFSMVAFLTGVALLIVFAVNNVSSVAGG